MNVIHYITITCNLKNGWLQITCDYMKKCNRLQITITPCLPLILIIYTLWCGHSSVSASFGYIIKIFIFIIAVSYDYSHTYDQFKSTNLKFNYCFNFLFWGTPLKNFPEGYLCHIGTNFWDWVWDIE
jgi:hypothetical protein